MLRCSVADGGTPAAGPGRYPEMDASALPSPVLVVDMGASGVIGDAGAATAQAGAAFLGAVVTALARHVDAVFPAEETVR